jgi:hypothetical protein
MLVSILYEEAFDCLRWCLKPQARCSVRCGVKAGPIHARPTLGFFHVGRPHLLLLRCRGRTRDLIGRILADICSQSVETRAYQQKPTTSCIDRITTIRSAELGPPANLGVSLGSKSAGYIPSVHVSSLNIYVSLE